MMGGAIHKPRIGLARWAAGQSHHGVQSLSWERRLCAEGQTRGGRVLEFPRTRISAPQVKDGDVCPDGLHSRYAPWADGRVDAPVLPGVVA